MVIFSEELLLILQFAFPIFSGIAYFPRSFFKAHFHISYFSISIVAVPVFTLTTLKTFEKAICKPIIVEDS